MAKKAVLSMLAILALAAAPPPKPAPAATVVEVWKTLPLPPPMPKPAVEGHVEVDGVTLWYATFGAGAPVILLHGGAGNSEHWANQLPALAEHFEVIVVDARGHGRSTRSKEPFSYELMAKDLLGLMDLLKLEKVALVGWSDGGIVALDLALRHPERVGKLFVIGTNYDLSGMKSGGGAPFTAYFAKCATDYAQLSPTPKDYQLFVDALRQMWKTQPNYTAAQLAKITASTVVADGDHDEIIRPEHLREMVKLIPNSKLVLIPEASHFAMWQQPEAVTRALLELLTAK